MSPAPSGARRQPRHLLRTLLAAASVALGLASPQASAFCGFYAGKADASLFNEASQVVLVRDGERTVLSMLNDYSGPLSEFALVVPTPTVLQQGQVRVAEKATFERLDAYSSPRLAEYHDSDPCRMNFWWGQNMYPRAVPAPMAAAAGAMRPELAKARDAALGVTVEAAYTLEEYDIVSLSAKQSDGLEIWLRENGYKIPRGASAALKPNVCVAALFQATIRPSSCVRISGSIDALIRAWISEEMLMQETRAGLGLICSLGNSAPPNKKTRLAGGLVPVWAGVTWPSCP